MHEFNTSATRGKIHHILNDFKTSGVSWKIHHILYGLTPIELDGKHSTHSGGTLWNKYTHTDFTLVKLAEGFCKTFIKFIFIAVFS